MELNLSKNGISCGEPGMTRSLHCVIFTYTWCDATYRTRSCHFKGFVLRNLSIWRHIRNVSTVRVNGHLPPPLYGRNMSPDELMRTARTRWYADISANETQMQARGEIKMKSRTNSFYFHIVCLCFMSCGRSDDNRFLVARFAILKNKKEVEKYPTRHKKIYLDGGGGRSLCFFLSRRPRKKFFCKSGFNHRAEKQRWSVKFGKYSRFGDIHI